MSSVQIGQKSTPAVPENCRRLLVIPIVNDELQHISVAHRRRLKETARGNLAAVCQALRRQPALCSFSNMREIRDHATQ